MFKRLLILLLCLGFSVFGISAQDDDILANTFTSEFGYQFDYPNGWEAEDNPGDTEFDDGSILLDSTGNLVMLFFEPQPLDIVGRGDTMSEVMANRWADFIVSDVTELEDLQGRALVGADLNYQGTPGIGFMVDFQDDTYGMLATYDFGSSEKQITEELLLLSYLVVSSLQLTDNAIGSGPPKEPSTGSSIDNSTASAVTLTNHDGVWQDAIEELQDAGVIGRGGGLVFNEPSAFFSGQGNFYTPLARNSPSRDIVMAAEVSYSASNTTEFETCTLMAGVQASGGNTNTYIEIGFANDGTLFFADWFNGNLESAIELESDVNFTRPRHVMFVIQGNEISAFLDGEQVASGLEMIERSGTYGIALTGRGAGASCQGDNIWVYEAPVVTPGLCEATTANTVNRRAGPGTNFDQAGQFTAGTVQQVLGQNTDGSFIWYKLDDNTWVREDIVTLRGDCVGLPTVK